MKKFGLIFAAMVLAVFMAGCDDGGGGITTGMSMTVTYPANVAGELTVKVSTEADFSVDTVTKSVTVESSGAEWTTAEKVFTIGLDAGDYYVRAFIDGGNGIIEKGEYAVTLGANDESIAYDATPASFTVVGGALTTKNLNLNRQKGYCQVSVTVNLGYTHNAGTATVDFFRLITFSAEGLPPTTIERPDVTYAEVKDAHDKPPRVISDSPPLISPGTFDIMDEITVNLDPDRTYYLRMFIDEDSNETPSSGELYEYYNEKDKTGTPDSLSLTADGTINLGTILVDKTY